MWCSQCRQDVPGAAQADDQGYRCPRCGEPLGLRGGWTAASSPPASTAGREAAGDEAEAETPVFLPDDGWEMDERLKHIERVLELDRRAVLSPPPRGGSSRLRFDSSHAGATGRQASDAVPAGPHAGQRGWWPAAIWWTLCLGLTALVWGGILLCWGVLAGRHELWTIGLPIAVGGQIALVSGLILQMDRLWQTRRPGTAGIQRDRGTAGVFRPGERVDGAGEAVGGPLREVSGEFSGRQMLDDLRAKLEELAARVDGLPR